ncbi:Sodium/calcium exchanger membrane region [Artemisia annua]|uniref:Sodium/calcium exchanger membrane region n=1 Tax=Artemisia annua TaxID=35608 RepID=A0A2U1MS73_ARTAN|nr:Sodium/calcium exchanger membrane region [Artemisia annua]
MSKLLHGVTKMLFYKVQIPTLVITAQNQFSKIVTTLSRHLNLTPSIGAVTLLALGNGAPDVFASLAAVGGGDGRMGFGAILSAGMFVSAVVVGFVAIYSAPFGVDAVSFVRDVLFYMTACLFLFYVYLSGEIWLWQAVGRNNYLRFIPGYSISDSSCHDFMLLVCDDTLELLLFVVSSYTCNIFTGIQSVGADISESVCGATFNSRPLMGSTFFAPITPVKPLHSILNVVWDWLYRLFEIACQGHC